MKIHEYQAKEILKSYGVPVPRGGLAKSAEEAGKIAAELGGAVVVKAQIHAGGRGKGGGVKLANSVAEAQRHASEIIGMNLVTHQTGPDGQRVKQVWVEESTDIDRELYLGIVLDRAQSRLVVMASQAGGMDIEQVAAETPEKILRETVDPGVGLQAFQARRLGFGLGLEGDALKQGVQTIMALYRACVGTDCSLAEINPLVVTGSGAIVALDAKMNFDDNALYRHKEVQVLRDIDEEAPLEVEASEFKWINSVEFGVNINADREQLFRVLSNLSLNAMQAGAKSVRVTARQEEGRLLVDVIDDGPGLSPRALEYLFQPFAGSMRVGGTGLGLIIARDIMRAHGGDLVLLESSESGATFRLELPGGTSPRDETP